MSSRIENFENATVANPCSVNLTWSNTDRTFKMYDKNTKTQTLVSLPMKFVVIDTFIKISGFDEQNNCSYFSNEIKDTRTEILTVKTKNGLIKSGLYSAIRDEIVAKGAKYSESIYVMLEDGRLANITLVGTNSQAWMEFKKENQRFMGTSYVGLGNPQAQKKGSVTWHVPQLRILDSMTDEHIKRADELYASVHEYKKQFVSDHISPPLSTSSNPTSAMDALISRHSEGESEIDTNIPDDMGF